jgi:uncharacterized membrane protein YeaQ/YmgE (transglycosylase-associated protein family)
MKIYPKAILIGLAADIGLSITFGVLETALVVGTTALRARSTSALLWSMVFGFMGCIIGGYATSHFSPTAKLFNALLFGIIETALGAALVILSLHGGPLWYAIAGFVLTIPAGLLGAYIQQKV